MAWKEMVVVIAAPDVSVLHKEMLPYPHPFALKEMA